MLFRALLHGWGEAAGTLPNAATRSLLACGTALLVCLAAGRSMIAWLRRHNVGERTEKTPIEDEALRRRIATKSGTPTMGGLVVLGATLLACALWADPGNACVGTALFCTLALGALGMADDRLKLRASVRRARGLKARHKLAAQAVIGAGAAVLLLRHAPAAGGAVYRVPLIPAAGGAAVVLFAVWGAFVVGTMSNATNVTDGLDGLLAGLAPLAAAALGAACYAVGTPALSARLGMAQVPGAAELSVFCGALAGACLGFLWYNRHPARVFMGDTGALAVGGGLAAAALAARQELLLALVGMVFLVEFGSSLLQIGFFKLSGRRILPIAPVHIIFERRGDPEPRIVHSFYVCGVVAALVGLSLLWL
ncbi:MAG: phospho-N-acetylmuramoyl-pentapeptide-transferase [Planctomycetota bacterium]|jgi:phospho-N-acetylmuramoyl-pentapeptide-transferase